ncbi:MAG: cytochrome c, partial [Planctomycetota bacterium]|nr:cytochrome c [Planctomycetota bacterium]
CASCHGPDGRGGGPSAEERNPVTGEMEPVKDDWGNPIIIRDLTRGLFRFGRRPIDLYRRIYAGINGTPMPSHSAMKAPGTNDRMLSDEDLWDIVHYVRSLSSHGQTVVTLEDAR